MLGIDGVFTYYCDACNKISALTGENRLRRRVIKGLAYEFYYNCGECGFEHIGYYTDSDIRRDIKANQRTQEKYMEQMDIFKQIYLKIDEDRKGKSLRDELTDEQMELVSKLEVSESEIRRIQAQRKLNDKMIKTKMTALKERMEAETDDK